MHNRIDFFQERSFFQKRLRALLLRWHDPQIPRACNCILDSTRCIEVPESQDLWSRSWQMNDKLKNKSPSFFFGEGAFYFASVRQAKVFEDDHAVFAEFEVIKTEMSVSQLLLLHQSMTNHAKYAGASRLHPAIILIHLQYLGNASWIRRVKRHVPSSTKSCAELRIPFQEYGFPLGFYSMIRWWGLDLIRVTPSDLPCSLASSPASSRQDASSSLDLRDSQKTSPCRARTCPRR